jgi:hypothetical protein
MDQKTITNRKSESRRSKHPYEEFESSRVWKILDKAIGELVENNDIKETTRRAHIVGYLCKKLLPELKRAKKPSARS